jgi:hypothetical protein
VSTAELLSRPHALDARRAPASVIELPPADVVPDSVRVAVACYAADPSQAARAELVAAVDRAGQRWERRIASRAVETRAKLVDACRRVAELHDELVRVDAEAQWLRAFPWYSSWDLEPYSLHVGGHEVAVPEILGAIEDTCDMDERLLRIVRRGPPRDPPYAPPAPRARRLGPGPAQNALAEAGSTLNDVAELMPAGASVAAVSLWLAGKRPYPAQLPDVLEQLVDAETAARIISLIPSRNRRSVIGGGRPSKPRSC